MTTTTATVYTHITGDENIHAGYHYSAVPKVKYEVPSCWQAMVKKGYAEQYLPKPTIKSANLNDTNNNSSSQGASLNDAHSSSHIDISTQDNIMNISIATTEIVFINNQTISLLNNSNVNL